MKCNVGTKEKVVRLIVAVVAGVLGYMLMSPCLYVIAAIALITAIIGYCPLSHLFGVSTCEEKEEEMVDGDNPTEPADEVEEVLEEVDEEEVPESESEDSTSEESPEVEEEESKQ